MTISDAKAFTSKWLPEWTGNQPELLASFYTEDAFYLDPFIPNGINGKKKLLRYFRKLLSANPNWVWTNLEVIFPTANGFLNKWLAKISVGNTIVECVGVCTVHIRDGLIERNEVFFDRSKLLNSKKEMS
ncbi:MAG: nuclear transport factor 2 family protein [Leptospiraceae bacterium]|nr:nuclear transport factor 2 family protein [Leptospiraceae bacterium]